MKNAAQSQSKFSTAASLTLCLKLQFAIPNQYSHESSVAPHPHKRLFFHIIIIYFLFMSEIHFNNTRFSYLLTLWISILSEMQFSFQVLY